MNKNYLYIIYLLIILTVLIRMLPHPMNITPIGALALFSGAYLDRERFILVPMAALILGDALIGFYSPLIMVFVYSGFILSTLIGRVLLHNRISIKSIGVSVCCSAIIFYLISNFGMWLEAFPHNLEGLIQCYVLGLPYLKNTFFGDVFYVCVIFGMYELLKYSVNSYWLNQLGKNA